VTLTNEGLKIGEEVDRRHKLIKSFLEMLGVPGDIADIDACEVEHSLNPKTLERLEMFLDAVHENPERYPFLRNDD
jgi:DtxR family Mn-dependent transcriptional regulator